MAHKRDGSVGILPSFFGVKTYHVASVKCCHFRGVRESFCKPNDEIVRV